jgi:SAM-dependent methyltransferase/GNAT superfamily N-acetyltransferase
MFTNRLATSEDLPRLRDLMNASIRVLVAEFLDASRVEASFEIMGLDRQLVDDGTYFVVEQSGRIAGCGGWSRRATLFGPDVLAGRDARLLDPRTEPARIRAMYTHPDFARQGVGRLVLSLCEAAARQEGFRSFEMMATAPGEPLYAAAGYSVIERVDIPTSTGVSVPCARMEKRLHSSPAISTPYDLVATEFRNARTEFRTNEERYLAQLVDQLKPGSSILDLGCGNGHPIATFLAARGFAITGVDASDAMLAVCRQQLPAHRWIHAFIEDIHFTEQFDAVVCWDALFHLERSKWPEVIRKIHRWLKPGGHLLLSSGGVVDDSGRGFTDTMFGHEFFYDSLPPQGLLDLLRETGFNIVMAEMCDQPDGGRGRAKWATLAARS